MKVNGTIFKTYLLDSPLSVKERIAVQWGTLVKYMSFDPELTSSMIIDNQHDVVVSNRLDSIIGDVQTNPLQFPAGGYAWIDLLEAETYFIQAVQDPQLLPYINGLTLINNPKFVWDQRARDEKQRALQLSTLKTKTDKASQMMQTFENIRPSPYTDLILNQVQFTIKISNPERWSMDELFNRIHLNKHVPFASYNSIYKWLKNKDIVNEWIPELFDNLIVLKVDNQKQGKLRQLKFEYKRFNTAAVIIKDEFIYVTSHLVCSSRHVSRPIYIERLMSCIKTPLTIEQETELSTVVFSAFPYESILIPIWQDLVMNNIYFRSIVAINELLRASKEKQNLYLHRIDSLSTITLVTKRTQKVNEFSMEKANSLHVLARIKTASLDEAEHMMSIMARLMTLYKHERDSILTIYRRMIPQFLSEEMAAFKNVQSEGSYEGTLLRKIAPDLFLPNYTRKCIKLPTIIQQSQIAQVEREKQVMMFPIYGESTQRAYMCRYSTHPFPGLRINPMENNKQFPFLPCCYASDQTKRKGSGYRHYFFKEKLEKKMTMHEDIYSTTNALLPETLGTLPEKTKKLFFLLDERHTYVRYGMAMELNVLFDALIYMLETPSFTTGQSARDWIDNHRDLFSNACRQEQQWSTDDEFNLLTSVHGLELLFQCNIFIFTSAKDGELVIPPHQQGYYKNRVKEWPTLFIYQIVLPNGSIHYEPIVRLLSNNNTLRRQFDNKDDIVNGMWSIFYKLNRSFISSVVVKPLSLPVLNIVSQRIDIYGKCRQINVKNRGDTIMSIQCHPIPPYLVPVSNKLFYCTMEDVAKFATDHYNIQLVSQSMNEKNQVEKINALWKSLVITFLVRDERVLDLPIVDASDQDRDDTTHVIEQFMEWRKWAKILTEYSYYMLAQKIQSDPLPWTSQQWETFGDETFTVIINYQYKVTTQFDPSSTFMSRGKIVVTSKEIIKRLMYQLKLMARQYSSILATYTSKRWIDNFYSTTLDFQQADNTLLVHKNDVNLLLSQDSSYIKNHTISQNLCIACPIPYFFYNTRVSSHLYLAQNVQSLDLGCRLIQYWNTYNHYPLSLNVLDTIEPLALKFINFMTYVNEQEITLIQQVESHMNQVILGYLVETAPQYTVLVHI